MALNAPLYRKPASMTKNLLFLEARVRGVMAEVQRIAEEHRMQHLLDMELMLMHAQAARAIGAADERGMYEAIEYAWKVRDQIQQRTGLSVHSMRAAPTREVRA